jgi:hypothetical protein
MDQSSAHPELLHKFNDRELVLVGAHAEVQVHQDLLEALVRAFIAVFVFFLLS